MISREAPMELRVLTDANLEELTALFASVFTAAPWHDDWSDAEQLRQYILDLTDNRNSLTLGYYDGNEMIGLSMGHIRHWYEGTEYMIDELCVRADRQGRGVGTAFLRDMEDYLRRLGIRRIFLLTERTVPAYCFYQKNGFYELRDNAALVKGL